MNKQGQRYNSGVNAGTGVNVGIGVNAGIGVNLEGESAGLVCRRNGGVRALNIPTACGDPGEAVLAVLTQRHRAFGLDAAMTARLLLGTAAAGGGPGRERLMGIETAVAIAEGHMGHDHHRDGDAG